MFQSERRAKPIVKWAGGKGNCLGKILERFPGQFESYVEPFVGGGAVFLSLKPQISARINDANSDLMGLYRTIRDNPLDLMEALDLMARGYGPEFYYRLRTQVPAHPVDNAARFLFLNKTCFNGLYRTNNRGEFNVPYGKRKKCPTLYDRANVLEVSFRLRNVKLTCTDFEAVIDAAESGDLVYCDPPYLPMSATANFSEYTAGGFSWENHLRLRDACTRAANRGAHVVLSNSASPRVEELYAGWKVEALDVSRSMNAKAEKRGLVRDVIAQPQITGA